MSIEEQVEAAAIEIRLRWELAELRQSTADYCTALRAECDKARRRADVMSQLLAPAALELGLLVEHVEQSGSWYYDTSDAKKIVERIARLSEAKL